MAKKNPNDLSVEERLKLLYQLQTALSAIDEKKAIRGELPLEVEDLEDEIEGLNTRIEKIQTEISEFQKAVNQKKGEITDEEMTWAKRAVASDLRSALDSQGDLEGYWLSQALDGLDYGPEELAELTQDVTKEDVMAVANSLECDLIYFLRGVDETPGEEEEDAEN
jgi:chromosome segregation ATPase